MIKNKIIIKVKNMRKTFYIWVWVILLTLCLNLSSCGGSNSSGGVNPSRISSVEDAKSYIDGKTFIATPSGQLWYKVSFVGNSFTLWTATPTDGHWGSPIFNGNYTVESQRYSNTGQQFFYTVLTKADDDYHSNLRCTKFIISDLTFVNCNAYNSDDRAKAKIGDRDPWK